MYHGDVGLAANGDETIQRRPIRSGMKPMRRHRYHQSTLSASTPYVNSSGHPSLQALPPLTSTPWSLGTVITNSPWLFGHPHLTAEPQMTEPFWQQYPYWTTPGNKLYYYGAFGGYFDHPLYISCTEDDEPLVVGYGRRDQFAKRPLRATRPAKHQGEMVEVYSSDLFVESISLKLLIRFSRAASLALTRFKARSTIQPETYGMLQENATYTGISRCADEANGWPNETEVHDESSVARSRSTSNPDATTSIGTSLTVPSLSPSIGACFPRAQDVHSIAFGRDIPKKRLVLDLPTVDMPSTDAVHLALKWMRDNANVPGDGELLEFAPPNLSALPFEVVIDFYQAALALEVRPFPRRIRRHLLDHITKSTPDMRMLVTVARCLPAEDPVVTRMFNRIEDRRQQQAYSAVVLERFDRYLEKDVNEVLRLRRNDILGARKHAVIAHELTWLAKARPQSGRDALELTTKAAVADETKAEESVPQGASSARNRRRRNRRAQQAVDASY